MQYAQLIFIKIPISKPIYQNRCKNRNANNYEMKFLRKIVLVFSVVHFLSFFLSSCLFFGSADWHDSWPLLSIFRFCRYLKSDSFHPITHFIPYGLGRMEKDKSERREYGNG